MKKPIATEYSFKVCEILNIKPLDFFTISNDLGEVCEGYIDEDGIFNLTDKEQEQSDSGYWISYAINHPESVEKNNSELALLQYKYISYLMEVFGIFNYISINEECDKITFIYSSSYTSPGQEVTIDVRPSITKTYKMDKLVPYKKYDIEEYWGKKYHKYNPDNPWCVSLGIMEEVCFRATVYGKHRFEGYITHEGELTFSFEDPHISVTTLLNKLINKSDDVVVIYLEEGDYEID